MGMKRYDIELTRNWTWGVGNPVIPKGTVVGAIEVSDVLPDQAARNISDGMAGGLMTPVLPDVEEDDPGASIAVEVADLQEEVAEDEDSDIEDE